MMDTGRPHRCIRGPMVSPSFTASRRRNMVMFFGPFSRMVVTPEKRALRAFLAA